MTKSFEQVLDQEKNELTEALILVGEGNRANKALADLGIKRSMVYKFYEAGQHSRQAEIDESFSNRYHSRQNAIAKLENKLADSAIELDELKEGLKTLLESYKAQSSLPMQDEFNRGWVSAFACVHNDLKNLIK